MCGMPYHAAQNYIAKLIKAGRRIAVCDQTSDPQPGKIVQREITQIITAGTVSELDLLDQKRANYLGAVYVGANAFGFAYADLTTGEFRLAQLPTMSALTDELARVAPSEVLRQRRAAGAVQGNRAHVSRTTATRSCRSRRPSLCANTSGSNRSMDLVAPKCRRRWQRRVRSCITSSISCGERSIISPRCAAMSRANMSCSISPRRPIWNWSRRAARAIPACSPRSIARSRRWADANCAPGFCNRCATLPELERRQQMIEDLLGAPELLAELRTALKSVRDLERAIGRLSQVSGNARDLVALRTSLEQIPALKRELKKLSERAVLREGPRRVVTLCNSTMSSTKCRSCSRFSSAPWWTIHRLR